MSMVQRVLIVVGCLLLIPVTAVTTAAVKQRFADGPNRLFSGGRLVAGELHAGPEPDWSFVRDIPTIELQLLDPPRSRRIWTTEYDGRLYVWSGYMGTTVGRWWKRWPVQAERDGRAVIRIDGKRYERQLVRILDDWPVLEAITAEVNRKYDAALSADMAKSGDAWFFALEPRLKTQ